MSEIPQDIMKVATRLAAEGFVNTFEAPKLIAAAILAERERCAKIAESMYTDYYGDRSGDIAEAIREGGAA